MGNTANGLTWEQAKALGAKPANGEGLTWEQAQALGAKPATAADTGRLALGPTQVSANTWGGWAARQALGALPAAGSVVGGLLGSGGGVPGAASGAAIGGAGGESLRQLLVRAIYGKGPNTSAEAATGVGEQGAMGAAGELVTPVVARGATALAGPLAASAVRSYSRALGPTTKFNKAVTAEVAPELIDRGVVAGTRQGLENKAAGQLAAVGPQIGAAEAGATAEQIPLKPVLDSLQKARQSFYVAGAPVPTVQPGASALISKVDALANTVVNASQNGTLSRESARSMRQFLDDQVSKAHGFALAPDEQTVAQLQKLTTDSLRRELNKARPDIAALNNEYSFWKNVHDVIAATNERTAGQSTPLTQQLMRLGMVAGGGALGYKQGGPERALELGAFGLVAPRLLTSTAWRTVSAVAKDRIAGLLASGQTGKAAVYLVRAAAQTEKGASDTGEAQQASAPQQ